MTEFSQGVTADGPVVLRDGQPMSVDLVVELLSTWSDTADIVLAQEAKTKALVAKAKTLVDAVSHDNNGSMVAGRYVGGNGGLYSTETIKTADALCLELDRWK